MKKISIILGFFFILSLAFAPTGDIQAEVEESVFLAKDEVIDDAYYIKAAGALELEGTVLGDVLVAGGNVYINGRVEGDVMAAGGNVKISGSVGGDVRAAGGSIEISGEVGGNVLAFGGSVVLSDESQIKGGVTVFAGSVELRGAIERNTRVGAGALVVAGELGDKLRAWVGDDKDGRFVVYPSAIIEGQVFYTSNKEVEIKEGADIRGGIEREAPKEKNKFEKPDNFWAIIGVGWLVARLVSFLALLIVGLVFLAMAPRVFREVREKMVDRPGASIGWGLVWLILTPIVSFIVMLTIIGLPLAGIALAMYLVMLYTAKVFASYLVGHQVLKWLRVKHSKDGWVLALGIFLFVLLASIPLIGWLVKCVLMLWALGAIIEFKKQELKRYR